MSQLPNAANILVPIQLEDLNYVDFPVFVQKNENEEPTYFNLCGCSPDKRQLVETIRLVLQVYLAKQNDKTTELTYKEKQLALISIVQINSLPKYLEAEGDNVIVTYNKEQQLFTVENVPLRDITHYKYTPASTYCQVPLLTIQETLITVPTVVT